MGRGPEGYVQKLQWYTKDTLEVQVIVWLMMM